MRTLFKRLALPIVMVLMSLSSLAATPGVTFLLAGGQTVSFAFASKPQIVVAADGLTLSSLGIATVSYQFSDVAKFYFEDNVETGISQVEGTVSARHPLFNYVGGVVSVSGMAIGERLAVVTLGGSLVKAAKADSEGLASIDLGSAPAGVYVVSTGSGVSFKLLKR